MELLSELLNYLTSHQFWATNDKDITLGNKGGKVGFVLAWVEFANRDGGELPCTRVVYILFFYFRARNSVLKSRMCRMYYFAPADRRDRPDSVLGGLKNNIYTGDSQQKCIFLDVISMVVNNSLSLDNSGHLLIFNCSIIF